MALKSELFRNDPKLQACAISNPAHITKGATGPHVGKLQIALRNLDRAVIDSGELSAQRYGNSTAVAVLKYKERRNIINKAYQSAADDIVGIMTIARMDSEMVEFEANNAPQLVALRPFRCAIAES